MMRKPLTRLSSYRGRQASILVCVLVCLAVATALVSSIARSALVARQEMRTQYQVRQTELLLTAGIQRAAQQLVAEEGYSGEVWILEPSTLHGAKSAQVEIEVSLAEEDLPSTVRVTAWISVTESQSVQRSHIFSINPDKE